MTKESTELINLLSPLVAYLGFAIAMFSLGYTLGFNKARQN
jgi:hypothetical protein